MHRSTPAALCRIAARSIPPDQPDRDPQLLRAFLSSRCEEAFAELVHRHGPMAFAVCRRILGHTQDAEDAFQAAFLVLARKAGTVRGDNLAGWLYSVVVRTAQGVRIMRNRRQKRDAAIRDVRREVSDSLNVLTGASAEQQELVAILDEELDRLPEHYRLPVVLCDLQGRSRKEAAAELKIPEGTLSSRLAAAKRKLADRLGRRGVTATATAVTAAFAEHATAHVPEGLVRIATGSLPGSAMAAQAAEGVVKSLFVAQLKGVLVAVGLATAVVCGAFLAPGGSGGAAASGVDKPKSGPVDPAAALVQQLGDPDFKVRETAEKALREFGVKAKPTLQAGARDPNPEVAKRSREVLAHVRKEQLWAAFAKVAGDDKTAQDLFAQIIASPRAVDALEAALDDPARADDLYRTRTAELLRVAEGFPPVGPDGKADPPDLARLGGPSPPVPLGDVAGWLFLGALQPGTAAWREVTHPGWQNRLSSHVPFLPEDDYTSAKPIAASYEGATSVPLKKLTAAWLAKRRENDGLRAGLALAIRYDITDAITAARIVLKDPKPTDVSSWNLAAAAVLVALHGTKDDLPLLARHAADDRSFGSWLNLPPGTDLTFAPPLKEGRDLFCHVRDAAVVAMCKLAGKDPAGFGFPSFPATKHPNGRPMSLSSATKIGFTAKADRAAAFEKAAAWLKSFEPPAIPKPDPEAEKLVKQLGDPDFKAREDAAKKLRDLGAKALPALQAGARDPSPEVAKRSREVLAGVRADLRAEFVKRFDPDDATADYDYPVWKRFQAIAGDDKPARKLFAEIIADPNRLRLLDEAEAEPDKAGDLYAAEVDRAYAVVQKVLDLPSTGVPGPETLPWPEFATILYLGTYPSSTGKVKDGWKREGHFFIPDRREWAKSPATPALKRIFSVWLTCRDAADTLERGFHIGVFHGVEVVLPFARLVAADKLPRDRELPAKTYLAALAAIAQFGTPADLPLFEKRFGDTTELQSVESDAPIPVGAPPPKPTVAQARDYAIGLAVLLHNRDPYELGFHSAQKRFRRENGRAAVAWFEPFHFGFREDKFREAAHKVAKAWLAEQKPKAAPKPDPEAEKLVKLLGDPDFATREAAGDKLRALGAKARPALEAALRDPNPEIAKRSREVLTAIRGDARNAFAKQFDPKKTEEYDHPVWKRFVSIVGDSKASRELFARIIANEKWLRTLDNAEADPVSAGHVYRVGIAEVFRDFDRNYAEDPEWPCNRGEEVAYLLLLGSYPDTPPAKLVGDEVVPASTTGIQFLGRGIIRGEGQIPHARGLAGGLEGKLLDTGKRINLPMNAGAAGTDRVFAKLFAAWLVRRDPGAEFVPLCFRVASMQRVPEILPLARRYAANDFDPRREVPPNATIAALELVAQLGTRADLPFFERHFGDETKVATEKETRDFLPLPPPHTTQLRDVALGLAVLHHGGNPEDFGFSIRKDAFKQKAGRYEIPWYSHFQLGFESEASRTAAFVKGRAWLAEQKRKVDPPGK